MWTPKLRVNNVFSSVNVSFCYLFYRVYYENAEKNVWVVMYLRAVMCVFLEFIASRVRFCRQQG